jgi:hypothetical protein
MTLPLITDTVSVYRLTRTVNKEAYGASPVITGLDCQIVPAGTEVLAIYGGNPSYSLFEIYFDENVTLKNGDKLVSGATAYVVRDVPMRVENRLLSYTKVVAEVVT